MNKFRDDIMPIGHDDVKRQGPPKAIGIDEKHPGLLRIQIPLNIAPDSDWIDCFKNPGTYKPDEAHPRMADIWGKILEYRFSEENLQKKVEWVDKYINQANGCYRRKMAEKEAEMKRQEEKANKEREKLESVNKVLGKL